MKRSIHVEIDGVQLEGILRMPQNAKALVLFSHGSGSSRFSTRNNYVAEVLESKGLASLLIDLLQEEEDAVYQTRFDIGLLTNRLNAVILWLKGDRETSYLATGLFGSSTGAASALRAAAAFPDKIKAVVSRGGRPDLAMEALGQVKAPTLLIVGGDDFGVIELNQLAFQNLDGIKKMEIVPGATHLFEEPGCLEEVARLAAEWFLSYLTPKTL